MGPCPFLLCHGEPQILKPTVDGICCSAWQVLQLKILHKNQILQSTEHKVGPVPYPSGTWCAVCMAVAQYNHGLMSLWCTTAFDADLPQGCLLAICHYCQFVCHVPASIGFCINVVCIRVRCMWYRQTFLLWDGIVLTSEWPIPTCVHGRAAEKSKEPSDHPTFCYI